MENLGVWVGCIWVWYGYMGGGRGYVGRGVHGQGRGYVGRDTWAWLNI